jgi:hypothetical protein
MFEGTNLHAEGVTQGVANSKAPRNPYKELTSQIPLAHYEEEIILIILGMERNIAHYNISSTHRLAT